MKKQDLLDIINSELFIQDPASSLRFSQFPFSNKIIYKREAIGLAPLREKNIGKFNYIRKNQTYCCTLTINSSFILNQIKTENGMEIYFEISNNNKPNIWIRNVNSKPQKLDSFFLKYQE